MRFSALINERQEGDFLFTLRTHNCSLVLAIPLLEGRKNDNVSSRPIVRINWSQLLRSFVFDSIWSMNSSSCEFDHRGIGITFSALMELTLHIAIQMDLASILLSWMIRCFVACARECPLQLCVCFGFGCWSNIDRLADYFWDWMLIEASNMFGSGLI